MKWKNFCGVRTRTGNACRCKALRNKRCKYHGGLSTGPKTKEGKQRVSMNLKKWRESFKHFAISNCQSALKE